MKPTATLLLLAVNAALGTAVAALWTGEAARWQAPASLAPDAASLAPERVDIAHANADTLTESLQRPLFAATRRPAPEGAEASAAAGEFEPVLLGVFQAAGAGKGVILRTEGEVRRVAVGEAVGQWTLHAVDAAGGAVFRRADEELQVPLRHLPQPAATTASTASTPRARAPEGAPRVAAPPGSVQRSLAERIAERRARAGQNDN